MKFEHDAEIGLKGAFFKGLVEVGEPQEQCIAREMKEETDLTIDSFELFSVKEFDDRIEYSFWKKANLDIEKVNLHEGQQLKWFTEIEARNTKLAYGFNEIVDDFFKKLPFISMG